MVLILNVTRCNTPQHCSFDAATDMEPNASMQPAVVCARWNNRWLRSSNLHTPSHSLAREGWEAIALVCAAIAHRLLALVTLLAFLGSSPIGIQAVSMIAPIAAIEQDDDDATTKPASSSAMDDSLGGSGHADPVHLLLTDGAWVGTLPTPLPPIGERTSRNSMHVLPRGKWHVPTALYLLYHCLLC
ncbi:MAG: hypothetical protein D6747_02255 [Chlorobiota bacterium]|nr:MAG: hypothetical protein D6747_02255 [Chlorobiota bacterium]